MIDYSNGVTTTFKAAINKVGKYEVRFVFWKFGTGDEEGERINGFDDGATITVVEGAVTGRIYPSNDGFDTDGRDEVELTIYLADRYGNLTSQYRFWQSSLCLGGKGKKMKYRWLIFAAVSRTVRSCTKRQPGCH